MARTRPIPIWVITAAIYIHSVLPANVIIAIGIGIAYLAGRKPDIWHVEIASNGILFAVSTAAMLLAGAVDVFGSAARRRRAALGTTAHPENSREAVQSSIERLSVLALTDRSGEIGRSLGPIRAAQWNHADPDMRRIARDLELCVASMTPPCEDSDPATRSAATARLAATLALIGQGISEAETARRMADEQAAATAARYVETKYRTGPEAFPD